MKLLDKIKSPEDLKKLNSRDVNTLSNEIREFLIDNVSKTGGHLASNLGVVELTLALHSSFNSPTDKIIWDVGHQSYVHKLITGRKDRFHTLRQYQGISGFPKRYESEHDHFDTGHSSTSISAALGMASARDLKNEKNAVVAVIGDGALTGGMALEALNHAGQSKKDVIVVLNDNEMSISENVGGISNYLNKIRTTPIYSRFKDDVEHFIERIPAIGKSVYKTAEKAKDCVKHFFIPGVFFEELGFTYVGPIDGHNYEELCSAFKNIRNISGPILLHVITKKGKGYSHAENKPEKYHGVGPFDTKTGQSLGSKQITYSDIVGDTLLELAKEKEEVVAITAAMPAGTGLMDFSKKYPNRFFDVGIAEQHAVTFAAGIAAAGHKPYFAVYSTFLLRGLDQVIHDVCLQNLSVTFLIDRAGIVGNDGETHHGIMDISMLFPIPNLTILSPKDGVELKEMLKYSLTFDGPLAIRYPRGEASTIEHCSNLSLEKKSAEIIYETGNDALVIATGHLNNIALEACYQLNSSGIKTTLLNPRFIKPIDEKTILQRTSKCKNVYVVEDNYKLGGFGSQIQSILNNNGITKEVKIFGLPDRFIEHGDMDTLFQVYGLTAENIVDTIIDDFDSKIVKYSF
ncbi:1-deoxy-D-xylulose-5-phosphate synthase [Serpentinicella sp. ANB-PHB4]|uniref:1-deoxy-D-xylulose-5-phosphate synthase n=1 Tax=Serpentinicella sp. ANB-PHB4 TaxID=3074076 RepID=UPI002866F1F3|nr:1-deoxy-D-xylulose-5-phosphate synthase [Serpentinicella sp. ANB-PHB4]MDR5658184.1 1-deoxy-D-xylulose-5-phosphate synthase [Serpentinicella sp. ANB-PHB4]